MDRIKFTYVVNQYLINYVWAGDGMSDDHAESATNDLRDRCNRWATNSPGFIRDTYGALSAARSPLKYLWRDSEAQAAIKSAKRLTGEIESRRSDEHGGWAQYIEFDRHGRGSCINVDIYGIDIDNDLYVIQVRQFERRYRGGYGSVRKTYFLIGYNENGNPFAHPISGHKIHAAIKRDPSPESSVRAAQAWIWGIPEDQLGQVLRNGDTALIPTKTPPKSAAVITPKSGMMRIIDSHWIYSRDIRQNGEIYAKNPTLRHLKGQHPTVRGHGWYRVLVGNRAGHHDFAKPTID